MNMDEGKRNKKMTMWGEIGKKSKTKSKKQNEMM